MKSVILAILAATAASAETVTVKLIGATTVGTVTLDRGAANKTIGKKHTLSPVPATKSKTCTHHFLLKKIRIQ